MTSISRLARLRATSATPTLLNPLQPPTHPSQWRSTAEEQLTHEFRAAVESKILKEAQAQAETQILAERKAYSEALFSSVRRQGGAVWARGGPNSFIPNPPTQRTRGSSDQSKS